MKQVDLYDARFLIFINPPQHNNFLQAIFDDVQLYSVSAI